MIDVADLYLDNLYVEGTLELDQSTASGQFSNLYSSNLFKQNYCCYWFQINQLIENE